MFGGVSGETHSAFGSIVTLYSTFPLISDEILTRNGADSNLSVPLSTFPICASSEMVGVLEIDDAHGGENQAEVELAKEI